VRYLEIARAAVTTQPASRQTAYEINESNEERADAPTVADQSTDPRAALALAEQAYDDCYRRWTSKHDELIIARASDSTEVSRLRRELDALLEEYARLRAAYGLAQDATEGL
jgi:hypothetical protein